MSQPKTKASLMAIRLADAAFRQYASHLHAYLMRRMHGEGDVPNLAMEVYERFLRVKKPEAIQNPRAYLFRIATSVVGDARRLEARSPVSYDSELLSVAGERMECSTQEDAIDEIYSAQKLQEVYDAIAQLRPMHGAVLLLAVRDDLSHKEVANRTGLTVNTVKLYVCEARAQLRAILDRQQGM